MKKFLFFLVSQLYVLICFAQLPPGNTLYDTAAVIKLNSQAFKVRMTNPRQTLKDASTALSIALKINYTRGIAEAYRVIGIGDNYSNNFVKAIDNYIKALTYAKKAGDLKEEGKINNNIGILYRTSDVELALDYFHKALNIGIALGDNKLIAPTYLNIGDIYYRKKSFSQALAYIDKSQVLYDGLKDTTNVIQCLQTKGVIYLALSQYDDAKLLLLKARIAAIQLDLNEVVGSIDQSLASIYIARKEFDKADKMIKEGVAFSTLINDEKLLADYKWTAYQLETKRKNYKKALGYLQAIYHKDSTDISKDFSTQLNVKLEQVNQQARQSQYQLLVQRQKYDRVKFLAVALVATLLLVLVGVLISNVKRKTETNARLTALNTEVLVQKDNLDRINHHLEEIIDERTVDLQGKNKKLSEYSSYLSHQIRGPIATLKGLLNLEKEKLVDKNECIRMMNKTVTDIDDKIIEMSDMLHDPDRPGF